MLRIDLELSVPSFLMALAVNRSPETLLQGSPSVDASPEKNSIFVGVSAPS